MITSIFVLESLENERLTGYELYTDTLKRYNDLYWQGSSKINIQYFDITDKVSFTNTLQHILDNVSLGEEIVIHFEMHGLSSLTGLSLKNGDEVKWQELQEILMAINNKLKNELNISMATCHGRYIYNILDYRITAPFKSCISARNTILSGEIIDDYTPFFQCLIQQKDVYKAYHCLSMDNPNSKFFIKDTETLIESIIEHLFRTLYHDNYELFCMYFYLFFDISLPAKDNESFNQTLSQGLGKYQKRYFMKT